jgi:hypothetical protein
MRDWQTDAPTRLPRPFDGHSASLVALTRRQVPTRLLTSFTSRSLSVSTPRAVMSIRAMSRVLSGAIA